MPVRSQSIYGDEPQKHERTLMNVHKHTHTHLCAFIKHIICEEYHVRRNLAALIHCQIFMGIILVDSYGFVPLTPIHIHPTQATHTHPGDAQCTSLSRPSVVVKQ